MKARWITRLVALERTADPAARTVVLSLPYDAEALDAPTLAAAARAPYVLVLSEKAPTAEAWAAYVYQRFRHERPEDTP